jgi:hypothetical protein
MCQRSILNENVSITIPNKGGKFSDMKTAMRHASYKLFRLFHGTVTWRESQEIKDAKVVL